MVVALAHPQDQRGRAPDMNLRSIVALEDSDPGKPAVNVFASPQSLVSFSGATGAALAITSVLHNLAAAWDVALLGIGASFFVEGVIFLIGYDARLGRKDNLVAFLIAIINTFVIIAAVLGIQVGGITK
jgi:hypothetical protein